MTGLWLISYIALWLLLLVTAIALVSVLRNLGVLYDMVARSSKMSPPATNLEAGQALPELTLHTLSGNDVSLAKFHGVKTAFSIVSPHCSPCHSLLEAIAKGDEAMDKLDPTVQRRVIVSLGNVTETADLVRETRLHQGLPVLVDTENEVAKRWGVTSTPVTVIVDDKLTVVRQFVGAGSGTA